MGPLVKCGVTDPNVPANEILECMNKKNSTSKLILKGPGDRTGGRHIQKEESV
jgi:hypothetical protein